MGDLLSRGFEVEASFGSFLDKLERIVKNDPYEMDWDLCPMVVYKDGGKQEDESRGRSNTPRPLDESCSSNKTSSLTNSGESHGGKRPQGQQHQCICICKCVGVERSGAGLDDPTARAPGSETSPLVTFPSTSHLPGSNSVLTEGTLQRLADEPMAPESAGRANIPEQLLGAHDYSNSTGLNRDGIAT